MEDREQLGLLLSAYIDGEMAEGERARVEQLLAADPAARELLAELRQTAGLVGALPRHGAPLTLADDLERQIERDGLLEASPGRGGAVGHGWRNLAIAACLLLLIGGGMWIGTQMLAPAELGETVVTNAVIGRSLVTPSSETASLEDAVRDPATAAAHPIDERLLAVASFDQKLAAGVDTGRLEQHDFSRESNQLQVAFIDEMDRDGTAAVLMTRLRELGAEDVQVAAGSRLARPDMQGRSLYFEGDAERNFKQPDTRQILVRVPAEMVDDVVAEVARSKRRTSGVRFQAGPIAVSGWSGTEAAASRIAQPVPSTFSDGDALAFATAPAERTGGAADEGDALRGLIASLGVDSKMVPGMAKKGKGAADEDRDGEAEEAAMDHPTRQPVARGGAAGGEAARGRRRAVSPVLADKLDPAATPPPGNAPMVGGRVAQTPPAPKDQAAEPKAGLPAHVPLAERVLADLEQKRKKEGEAARKESVGEPMLYMIAGQPEAEVPGPVYFGAAAVPLAGLEMSWAEPVAPRFVTLVIDLRVEPPPPAAAKPIDRPADPPPDAAKSKSSQQ